MSFYPATTQIDFYIQADTLEEAQQLLDNIVEQEAFQHDTFKFPEIEQPEYNDSCVLDITDSPDSTPISDDRDKIHGTERFIIGFRPLLMREVRL